MADLPFERTVINLLERPVSTDINQAQSQLDAALRETVRRAMIGRNSSGAADLIGVDFPGFLGSSFRVTVPASPGMAFGINSGVGFIPSTGDLPSSIGGTTVSGMSDLPHYKPVFLNNSQTVAVDAAPGAGTARIDLVEVFYDRQFVNPQSRDVLDPGPPGIFNPATVNKTLTFTLDGLAGRVVSPASSTTPIGYKVGVAAASPAIPPTTSGYVPIAYLYVKDTTTVIGQANIAGVRPILSPHGTFTVSGKFTVANAFGGGTVAQNIDYLVAPSGFRAACFSNTNSVNIAVFGEGIAAGASIAGHVSPLHAFTTGDVFLPSVVATPGVSTVNTTGDAALFAACSPAIAVPPGGVQRYADMSFFVLQLTSGSSTLTAPTIPFSGLFSMTFAQGT